MNSTRSYYQNIEVYHELAEASHAEQVFDKSLIQEFVRTDDMVIDVAGGTGFNSQWLGISPDCYVAADYSYRGLAQVLEGGRGSAVSCDVAHLPFRDEAAQTILCSWALEHFEDPEEVLDDMVRVVKPGGCILIWGPNWDNILRKDFPQFVHRPWWRVPIARIKLLMRMLRNEFLPFRYRPYVDRDVAAFADPTRFISGDTDAVHCVLCQETVKYFTNRGFRVELVADFSLMQKHVHNSNFIRAIRAFLRPGLFLLKRIPILRWFAVRFPLVVRKPPSEKRSLGVTTEKQHGSNIS
jgi:ubiquinone/menaquinone biosynthesis C-methylase UbiE